MILEISFQYVIIALRQFNHVPITFDLIDMRNDETFPYTQLVNRVSDRMEDRNAISFYHQLRIKHSKENNLQDSYEPLDVRLQLSIRWI